MALDAQQLGIDRLTVGERLELIQLLWESLPLQVDPQEVPPRHREILDQRLAAAEASPANVVPWRDVLAQLAARP